MIKDVTASYQCDSVSHQAFSVQAQCFIDQYGNYTVPELIPVLGEEDAHVRKYLEKIARIFSHSKNISVEWKKHAGRKYRGQWRCQGEILLHSLIGLFSQPSSRPDQITLFFNKLVCSQAAYRAYKKLPAAEKQCVPGFNITSDQLFWVNLIMKTLIVPIFF